MPHFFNLTIEHHTAGSSAGDYEVGDPIAIALLSLDAVGVLHLPPEKTFQLRGNNFSKYPGEILELFGKHPMTLGHTWARNQLKDGFTGFPFFFQSLMWHTYIESYINLNLLEPIKIPKVGVVHVLADYF